MEYFDTIASFYSERSRAFPWSWLRAKEFGAVIRMALPTSKGAILDLGCGAGFYAGYFLRTGTESVVGVDTSPSMIQSLPAGVRGIVADAQNLKLDEEFDLIVCAGFIEFVKYPEMVLRSGREHLASNGCFMLLYPRQCLAGQAYRLYHRFHGIVIRLFSEEDIVGLANRERFRVVEICQVWPFTGVVRLEPR